MTSVLFVRKVDTCMTQRTTVPLAGKGGGNITPTVGHLLATRQSIKS